MKSPGRRFRSVPKNVSQNGPLANFYVRARHVDLSNGNLTRFVTVDPWPTIVSSSRSSLRSAGADLMQIGSHMADAVKRELAGDAMDIRTVEKVHAVISTLTNVYRQATRLFQLDHGMAPHAKRLEPHEESGNKNARRKAK